jgi:hypothetical protein
MPLFSGSGFGVAYPENHALAISRASEVDGPIDLMATPPKGKSGKESGHPINK